MDAPVGTWRLGGMVMAGELEAGDEVLIVTCEREIRPWWLGGKVHDPQSRRMHAAEDSVILPWISNLKRVITAQAAGTLYLGREDGSAGLTITRGPAPGMTTLEGTGPGSIALGSAAVNTLLMYPPFASAFATWASAMASAGSAVASPGVPDPTGALYTAYAAAVTTATAALATAVADAPTVATIKAVAE